MSLKQDYLNIIDAVAKKLSDKPEMAMDRADLLLRTATFLRAQVHDDIDLLELLHAMMITVGTIIINGTPAEDEVTIRESWVSMLFDYMTAEMETPVCDDCGYPHENDCDDIDHETLEEASSALPFLPPTLQ